MPYENSFFQSARKIHRYHRTKALIHAPKMVAFQPSNPLTFSPSCPTLRCLRTPSNVVRMTAQNAARPNQKSTNVAPSKRNEIASSSITPRQQDYAQWYQDVISSADLAEASPVRGCLVIKPHGYTIWELLRDHLDSVIKASGAKNAYFPIFIPQSFLSKEAEHVEGFAKECAVVTHHRLRNVPGGEPGQLEPDPDAELEEKLVVRPTSETMIWSMYSRWIQSYRDLPLMLNQWANVVRWEMRTRPFLRTSEFLWQEGHTAHATAEEAHDKAKQMIAVYRDVVRDMLAMPVIVGCKSPIERFAGADETYTIEAIMQNGWALQAGTSHFLGQNFARAFDVSFKSAEGTDELVWASSWGVTTRMIGALIMTHSDDTGLVLPPSVSPIQVVLVLIFKNDDQRQTVVSFADDVAKRLKTAGVRVHVDDRPGMKPGAKYYEWERKGVPLRMEVGPKDAAKSAVFTARRTGGPKKSVPVEEDFEDKALAMLEEVQSELYNTALERLRNRTFRVSSYDEMKQALEVGGDSLGMFLVPWKCNSENEKKVKEETKATLRCYPLEGQDEHVGKTCFYSGDPATHMAIFSRAY